MMRNLADQDQGAVLQRHQPQGPAADLPEGGADDLAPADLRAARPPGRPRSTTRSEPVIGLPDELPPITGLVLTSLKENELVEVPIISPLPTGQVNPLLAHWTYGLGRSVAFTSDAGRRWAKAWPDWESYAAFWSQVVRWSMRPVDRGNLTLDRPPRRGADQGRRRRPRQGQPVPQLPPDPGERRQPRPEADADRAGPDRPRPVRGDGRGRRGQRQLLREPRLPRARTDVQGVISSGVSVPYSDEYRELRSNPATLETIASLTDGQVVTWKYRPDGRIDLQRTLDAADHFRRDPQPDQPPGASPTSGRACSGWRPCLFLGDVAVRRVAPDFDRIRKPVADQWKKLRGQEVAPPVEYMEKLKSRKAEVGEQIDRSRAATRFEAPPPSDDADVPPSTSRCSTGGAAGPPARRAAGPRPRPPAWPPTARRPESPRATPTACSRPSRRSGRSARRTRASRG